MVQPSDERLDHTALDSCDKSRNITIFKYKFKFITVIFCTMKLIEYFKEFLKNEVNLNKTRIELLDKRVVTITGFLKQDEKLSKKFIDTIPQGSYAHKTIIKPVQEYHEFDADLLFYLEGFEDWQPKDYVNNIYNVFKSNSIYKDIVKRKDRCIVIDYKGDFHIDIVPFLERHGNKYITNRNENSFELTNSEAYNTWIDDKNRVTNGNFVKVVRLLKYIRDYKTTFSIKSVVLNVLLGDRINDAALLQDPSCYQDLPTTLRTVMNSLKKYVEENYYMPIIYDPGQTGDDLSKRWDQEKYNNFRNRIIYYAGKIEDAYTDDNKDSSLEKWQLVFGDDFKAPEKDSNANNMLPQVKSFNNTEQSITDLGFAIKINPSYKVVLQGKVLKKDGGFRPYLLSEKGNKVTAGRNIEFSVVLCTVPSPYKIFWKVLNRGEKAISQNCIRGQIQEGGKVWKIKESTNFRGDHYVECYIIRDNVCVARNRQIVSIL